MRVNYRLRVSVFIIILSALISNNVSFAQTVNVDELSKTVVFLRHQSQATELKGGEKVEVWYRKQYETKMEPKINQIAGTGFIIKHNDRDYLVTAKHVASLLPGNSEILMNVSNDKYISVTLNDLKKTALIKGSRWFVHPLADIAIHPLGYSQKVEHVGIQSAMIPQKDASLSLLSNVYVVGFPLGLGVLDRLKPLAKKVQTASDVITIERPEIRADLRFVLLDQALAQGFSGAPVFCGVDIMASNVRPPIKVGELMNIIGIVSLQIPDISGGKLTAIVPISYLWDILKSSDFTDYENKLPAAR